MGGFVFLFHQELVGAETIFVVSPLFGEDVQFDVRIFFRWVGEKPPPKFRAMEGGELTAEHIENRIDVLTTASWHFGVGLSHQILGKFPEILAKSSLFLRFVLGTKEKLGWAGRGVTLKQDKVSVLFFRNSN